MTIKSLLSRGSIVGAAALMMAGTASAVTITYNTNAPSTGFGGVSLTLNSSSGVAATLTFIPQSSITGVPSTVSFGNFTLVCETCTTQAIGSGAFFSAFTFNLIVTDVTDGATGRFVGTSSGGAVFSDVSQLTVSWAPLQLGTGTNNALTGNFGPTSFTTTNFTGIPAPNSGSTPGRSTVEGYISSAEVPEPTTLSAVGAALLGLGIAGRKKLSRKA
jgi:hypothetical protein